MTREDWAERVIRKQLSASVVAEREGSSLCVRHRKSGAWTEWVLRGDTVVVSVVVDEMGGDCDVELLREGLNQICWYVPLAVTALRGHEFDVVVKGKVPGVESQ